MSRSLKDRWSSRLARASLFALVALGALAAVALAATINDTLIGTSAADTINGLGGNDQIFSNQGKDIDSGGSGWALADTRDVGQRRRLTSVLPMGAWVLREACAQLATWSAAFPNARSDLGFLGHLAGHFVLEVRVVVDARADLLVGDTEIARRFAYVDGLVAEGVVANRSEAVRLGLESLVDRHRRRRIGAQIAAAYRRQPQTDEEVAGLEEVTRALVEEEPW